MVGFTAGFYLHSRAYRHAVSVRLGTRAPLTNQQTLVVTPNFTESVAESVDYGKYMEFDFPYI